jgi:hypothetical protein
VCNGLGVCCDTVVHFTAEVDILGIEARQDFLDKSETFVLRTVLNQDLGMVTQRVRCNQNTNQYLPMADPWGLLADHAESGMRQFLHPGGDACRMQPAPVPCKMFGRQR